MVLVVT